MTPLLQNLQQSSKLSMLRNATWTLSNFCRGKPQPQFELVAPALPTLARLIYSTDEEVLTDACWALSYLSDGSNDKIQSVIEAGVCRRLVELLLHTSFSVQTPALRTIGNIVTGDDLQTQVILNVSALPCLLNMLASPKKGIKKAKKISKKAIFFLFIFFSFYRKLVGPSPTSLQETKLKSKQFWMQTSFHHSLHCLQMLNGISKKNLLGQSPMLQGKIFFFAKFFFFITFFFPKWWYS
jgi:hypothetical protein